MVTVSQFRGCSAPAASLAGRVWRTLASLLLRKMVAILLLACAPQMTLAGEDHPSNGVETEAAFLVGLTTFIDWPLDAFSSPESPLVICAVATDPLVTHFAEVADGENVGKRPIRLRVITASHVPDECHILYLGSESGATTQIAKAVGHRPVLTVSRSKAAAYQTAMIDFTVDHGRVRFDIDNATAVSSRLAISSKLLALARNVTPLVPGR